MCFQYPENYIPATNEIKSKLSNSKKKRTLKDTKIEENEQSKDNVSKSNTLESEDNSQCPTKKVKIQYKLEKEAEKLIGADVANKKYWDDCKELLKNGKKVYIFIYNYLSYLMLFKQSFIIKFLFILFN